MRKCKLGEIAKFKTGPFGTQFKAAEYTQSGYPVINVKNIGIGRIIDNDIEFVSEKTRNRLSEHIIHEGDIVFARKGSVERHTYVRKEHDGWVQGSDCIKAKIDAGIEPRYVSYYLCLESVKKQLMLKAVGSTMPSMNTDILKDIAITLPDDEGVEKRIADFFDNINEKILSNEKIIATLESMAKTLYDYWFVQFDFPDANGRPYKTSGGKMVWNENLSREIPAGWNCESVKDTCDVQYGYPFDTNLFSEEKGVPVVRIRDIQELSTSACTKETVDKKYQLKRNDLIVGMDGNFHMNFWAGKEALLNQRVFRIRGREDISTLSVYFAIKPYIEHREKNVTRTTVGHLSDYDVKSLKLILPEDIEFRKKIATKFEGILNHITNIREENWKLTSLRDYLLPMLMNGQVTFRQ